MTPDEAADLWFDVPAPERNTPQGRISAAAKVAARAVIDETAATDDEKLSAMRHLRSAVFATEFLPKQ